MTRKFLQNLGLESATIDNVMDAYGDGINREKEKAKTEKESLTKEIENLRADFDKLKTENQSGEESFKAKYEAEKERYTETKTALEKLQGEVKNNQTDGLVKALLSSEN